MRTAKVLARLRGCAGSPEPSLVAYVISTIISCAGSNVAFCFVVTALIGRPCSYIYGISLDCTAAIKDKI